MTISPQMAMRQNTAAAPHSPIKNFVSLDEAIRSGGQRAERAQRIISQFSNTTVTKANNNACAHEADVEIIAPAKKAGRSFNYRYKR